MNTDFVVTCGACGECLNEVEVIDSGGIRLHVMICSECGRGAMLVTNTLCEMATKFLASTDFYLS